MRMTGYIMLALRAVKSNLLRTVLTILIIAVGISALVGILTAIDSLESSLTTNFASMGSNTFNLRDKWVRMRARKHGKRSKRKPITYREALAFKKQYDFPGLVSVSTNADYMATLKYRSKKTNPNVGVTGVSKEYIKTSGFELKNGRNFSPHELSYGMNVAIIGEDVRMKLFGSSNSIINQKVSINNKHYKIIGVLNQKGSSMLFSMDNVALIPLKNARSNFNKVKRNYVVSVKVSNVQLLQLAVGEATGLFRKIRGVKLGEDDNFEITKSDSLSGDLIEILKYMSIAATVIGLITILGAAIGLMNILLVAVTERTREIGISKALGATSGIIKKQFLAEAIVICQIGGLLGIILGILFGNGVAFLIGGHFIIPWMWMLIGILLCLIVGISSGIYPAIKASKLNPIDALRYE